MWEIEMWPCSSRGTPSRLLAWKVFGETLGHDDHAVLLAFLLLANPHRLHDPVDHLLDVHHGLDPRLAIGAGDRFLAADTCRGCLPR